MRGRAPEIAAYLRRRRGSYRVAPRTLFYAPLNTSGVELLPDALEINGASVLPSVRHNAIDADAADWPKDVYGDDLAVAGAGSDPTPNDGSPFLGADDDSVRFNAGKYYAGSDGLGQIATEDFAIELVIKHGSGVNKRIVGTRDGVPKGWELFTGTVLESNIGFLIGDAGGNTVGISLVTGLASTTWYHILIFADRSGSIVGYANAAAGAPVVISSRAGSLTSGVDLIVGALTGGAPWGKYNGSIAYLATWKRDSWLDSHLQQAVVSDFFARLLGLRATVARGTDVPSVATRASVATARKLGFGQAPELYTVGSHWIAPESVRDAHADLDDERVASNAFPSSEDLTHASWTKVACTIETATGQTFLGRTVHGIVGTAVDTVHSLATALVPADPHKHIMVCVVKAGAKSAVRFSSTDLALNATWQQFDLTGAGALGLAHGTATIGATIEKVTAIGGRAVEDGWYACCFHYDGGAYDHTHLIIPIDDAAVDDTTYTGDGATVDLHVALAIHDFSDPATGRETLEGDSLSTGYVKTEGLGRTLGYRFAGVRVLPASINHVRQSRAHGTAPWTAQGTVTVTPNTAETLDRWGEQRASKVTGLGDVDTDRLYQSIGGFTAAAAIALAIDLKPVAGSTGVLKVFSASGAARGEWTIDLSSVSGWQTLTAQHAAVTVVAPFVATGVGTSGLLFSQGSGTVDIYLGAVSLEERANRVPTPHIETTTSFELRDATVLAYALDDGNLAAGRGTMEMDVLVQAGAADGVLWSADDESADNAIALSMSSGVLGIDVVAATVSQASETGTTDIRDGLVHALRVRWSAGYIEVWLDGASEITATPATIPSVTTMHVGCDYDGLNQVNEAHYAECRLRAA